MAEIQQPENRLPKDSNTGNGEKKSQMLRIMLALLLLVGLGGGGWWWYQSLRYVSTDDARVSGTIVSVSAKIAGRVTEVLVKEGDAVQVGQVLLRIDPRDAAAQKSQAQATLALAVAKYQEALNGSRPQEIDQSRAKLEQAQADVEKAEASLENARKNFERLSQLHSQGAISNSQRDDAETLYLVALKAAKSARDAAAAINQELGLKVAGSREEVIQAAEAQVKQAQAALELATLTEEYTTVKAPGSGVVALKSVNPGEVVTAGQSLFTVIDLQDVWVSARIEEDKIGKINIGDMVEYTIDGYPGRKLSGKVYEMGSAASSVFALVPTENTSGNFTKVTQRIPIKISLPQDSGLIFRPGMSAVIKIHLQ
ncbi:MAG TPA: HlyD family secretion protein [Patescibacteria group bacterium]|nr:HlyD family secretion protein [Patescibacteria group bacterium]